MFMKRPEEKFQPKIHFGAAPSSPYVIDLRRRQMAAHKADAPPVEARSNEVDASADLLPGRNEFVGQIGEQDFTPSISRVSSEPFVPAEFALRQPEAAMAQLDLPEDDDAEESSAPLRQRMTLPHGWHRAIAVFVGLSFLFVLPIHAMQQIGKVRHDQATIRQVGERALNNLRLGAADFTEQDFAMAKGDFERAGANFAAAMAELDALSLSVEALLALTPASSKTFNNVTSLVQAGERLSQAAALLSAAAEQIHTSPSLSLVGKLEILTVYLERIYPLIAEAEAQTRQVDVSALPADQRAVTETMITDLPTMSSALAEFLSLSGILQVLLGADEPMRYLLLFQNNAELRATGGFIGSFAEMTVMDGEILEMQVPGGGSYDLQGSLSEFVAAPDPLQLINARWEFQDGNWFPDFAASADKLLWFYDHAGGPTVDGVIAINATFVADLLALFGSIEMPAYGRTITNENFLIETQRIVELEADPSLNKPKQFLADLTPKLMDRLTAFEMTGLMQMVDQVGRGLIERDVQLYFKDAKLQNTVEAYGWSGKVVQTSGDYVMLVNSNVGGGKTDLVIDEQIDLEVKMQADGMIINTITITREHKGVAGELFSGVNNVNYHRLYVPEGSVLIAASGDFAPPGADLLELSTVPLMTDDDLASVTGEIRFDPTSGTTINQEFGKTVFGNWTQTKPGGRSTFSYTYALPFALEGPERGGWLGSLKSAFGFSNTASYDLYVQQQSGAFNRRMSVRVANSAGQVLLWSSDTSLQEGMQVGVGGDEHVMALFEIN